MPDTPTRNPTWVWDELVLACDTVVQNGWRGLESNDPRVTELSALLQTLPLHSPAARLSDFRNPNGVARKSFDIATAHPDYPGVPTHGGATDKRVIAEFLARPGEMRAEAAALRAAAARGDFAGLSNPADEEDDDFAASEGRLLIRRHVARERDPRLRRRKIESVLVHGGSLTCEACGFDFEETYGERGYGYIECHHVVPLHSTTGPRSTRLSDLALLCQLPSDDPRPAALAHAAGVALAPGGPRPLHVNWVSAPLTGRSHPGQPGCCAPKTAAHSGSGPPSRSNLSPVGRAPCRTRCG